MIRTQAVTVLGRGFGWSLIGSSRSRCDRLRRF